MDIVALLGVQRGVRQQGGHADHAIERRADFVTHGGQKSGFGTDCAQRLFTRSVQLGGAACHPCFQRLVGLVQCQGLGLDDGAAALQFFSAVVQGLRKLPDLGDAGMPLNRWHLGLRQLGSRFAQALEMPAQAPRQGNRQQGPQQQDQPGDQQRLFQRRLRTGGKVALGHHHHQTPAHAHAFAKRPQCHHQRVVSHRNAVQERHALHAGLQCFPQAGGDFGSGTANQGVKALQRLVALQLVGRAGKEFIAGRAGHQQTLLIDQKNCAMRADAHAPQHLAQGFQGQIQGEHSQRTAIVAINGLRQCDAQLAVCCREGHGRKSAPLLHHCGLIPGPDARLITVAVGGLGLPSVARVFGPEKLPSFVALLAFAHLHHADGVLRKGFYPQIFAAKTSQVDAGNVRRHARQGKSSLLEQCRHLDQLARPQHGGGIGRVLYQAVQHDMGLLQMRFGIGFDPLRHVFNDFFRQRLRNFQAAAVQEPAHGRRRQQGKQQQTGDQHRSQ